MKKEIKCIDSGLFKVIEETVDIQGRSDEDKASVVITWGRLKLHLTETETMKNEKRKKRIIDRDGFESNENDQTFYKKSIQKKNTQKSNKEIRNPIEIVEVEDDEETMSNEAVPIINEVESDDGLESKSYASPPNVIIEELDAEECILMNKSMPVIHLPMQRHLKVPVENADDLVVNDDKKYKANVLSDEDARLICKICWSVVKIECDVATGNVDHQTEDEMKNYNELMCFKTPQDSRNNRKEIYIYLIFMSFLILYFFLYQSSFSDSSCQEDAQGSSTASCAIDGFVELSRMQS